MTKYLLIKGINGFGNMISVLNIGYMLAKKTNRTLVIDWTHPEWKLGFDEYFIFKDKELKYLEYNIFLEKTKDSNLEIYPAFFKNNLNKNLIELKPTIDKDNNYGEFFDNCIRYAEKKSSIDIIVFSYNWLPYNGIKNLWKKLELNQPYKEYIENKIKELGKYNAIHIRNTDIKNVNLNWAIEYFILNNDKKIYLATDDRDLLNKLQKIYINIINFTTFFDNKPLHNTERPIEQKYKTNLDTLTDLYILINSQELKITPIKTVPFMTTFSMLAYALKN